MDGRNDGAGHSDYHPRRYAALVHRRKVVAGGWAAKTRVRLAYNDVGTTLGFWH
jgi:hypothetical protein